MVNERVSAAVADSGLKQKFIAERIGVTEPVFSAILAGNRKISVDEFFGICDVLKMDPDTLYNYERSRKEA